MCIRDRAGGGPRRPAPRGPPGEFEETFAAEKVGVEDLVEARDAGDLGELLADCGLKAGERARLKRELAKLRPVL